MSNFLVAAFIVFLVSMITFSAVFIMAVRLRLLPARPEVTELVDRFLSFNFFRPEHIHEKILIGTDSKVWAIPTKQHSMPFSVFSAAAATLFVVLTPMESVEPRVTVRVQNGRENLNAVRSYSEVLVPEVFVWENREAA